MYNCLGRLQATADRNASSKSLIALVWTSVASTLLLGSAALGQESRPGVAIATDMPAAKAPARSKPAPSLFEALQARRKAKPAIQQRPTSPPAAMAPLKRQGLGKALKGLVGPNPQRSSPAVTARRAAQQPVKTVQAPSRIAAKPSPVAKRAGKNAVVQAPRRKELVALKPAKKHTPLAPIPMELDAAEELAPSEALEETTSSETADSSVSPVPGDNPIPVLADSDFSETESDSDAVHKDGTWSSFKDGRELGRGEYRGGVRQGSWVRWFALKDGEMFADPLYAGFETPLVSEATFEDGRLEGICTIVDRQDRVVCSWTFKNNELNGSAVWWHPSGEMRREANYADGVLDGEFSEWNADGKLASKVVYKLGRRHDVEIDWHAPDKKQLEGGRIAAGPITKTSYDWWNARLSTVAIDEAPADIRHGPRTWWYENGRKQLEGAYENDVPVGKFSWWYENGQQEREGGYQDGKQHGQWTWWHANGQKRIEGEYTAGKPSGVWSWWLEDGKLLRRKTQPRTEEAADEPATGNQVSLGS